LVTTPIPEVLTYFRSPRRSQPVWELQLAREREGQLSLLTSPDFIEGITAFQQRRAPKFTDS